MLKYQIFAEGDPIEPTEPTEPKTFTQEDVDALLASQKAEMEKVFDSKFNKKFAEMKTKAKEEADEAARLASLSAQERAEAERDKLQQELNDLRAANTRNEMLKESRRILSESNINVSDAVLGALVTGDAESTQRAVSAFAEAYNADVQNGIKSALAGHVPKASSGPTLTKAEIMAVKNTSQRQKLIAENIELFK